MKHNRIPAAILVGSLLIAVAILLSAHLFTPRYAFHVAGGIARLDTRTGKIVNCEVNYPEELIDCGER